jgi:hypothetical protein
MHVLQTEGHGQGNDIEIAGDFLDHIKMHWLCFISIIILSSEKGLFLIDRHSHL